MAKYFVKHRRGTTAQWADSGVVLEDGEFGIEKCTDGSFRIKVGDGAHKYSELSYMNLPGYVTDVVLAAFEESVDSDITALDEKLSGDITALDEKLSGVDVQLTTEINTFKNDVAKDLSNLENSMAIQPDWNQTDDTQIDFIKNKPDVATATTDGLMSAADKARLDGVIDIDLTDDFEITYTNGAITLGVLEAHMTKTEFYITTEGQNEDGVSWDNFNFTYNGSGEIYLPSKMTLIKVDTIAHKISDETSEITSAVRTDVVDVSGNSFYLEDFNADLSHQGDSDYTIGWKFYFKLSEPPAFANNVFGTDWIDF